MKFRIFFEIHPSGPFGVPEGTKTVLPAGPTKAVGDTYHTKTLKRVEYGTLSRYRDDENAINVNLNLGGITGTLKDNFLFLDVEASSGEEAYDIAATAVDRFLQHLSLSMQRLFFYKPLFIEAENSALHPVPKVVTIGSITMYDLDRLRTEIANTEKVSQLSDPVLDKALQYYEHSLFLFENRGEMTDISSRHFRYLIAAAFLNLWKAVSTIVGDPSIDLDYQSRYKHLGLDYDFFKSRIESVRNLRNEYDVAHYHVEPDRLKEIEQNFGKSKEVAERVLLAYRKYLTDGNPSFSKHSQR